MGILAWVFGILGGLSAVMGIITALEVIPAVVALTWEFWFMLGALLLLTCIIFTVSSGSYE